MRSETIRGIKEQSQFTVVVLGDAKTGKTAFVTQCIFEKMKTTYKPTVEDCYRTLTRLPDGKYKTVDVVDTAGSMEFPAMKELRIRSATLIVAVYDVDNAGSKNKVISLIKQVKQIREYDEVPIVVIGNVRPAAAATTAIDLDSKTAFPAGGENYEHFYLDIADRERCKKVYDQIIDKCYQSSTWKVEVWAIPPKRSITDGSIQRRRGLLSYLSFRKRPQKNKPPKISRSAKSIM